MKSKYEKFFNFLEKPQNLESYLGSFIDELNYYIQNGFILHQERIKIELNCFICDSPARALIKSMLW